MSGEKMTSGADDQESPLDAPMRPVFCYLAFGLAAAYLLVALALVCGAILMCCLARWWALLASPIAYAALTSGVSLLTKARYDLRHQGRQT